MWLKVAMLASNLKSLKKIITISNVLKKYYVSLGCAVRKIYVLPTGVNIDNFLKPNGKFGNPIKEYIDKINIVYVGHLYDWKGIPEILETAEIDKRFYFHLVGGLKEDNIRVKGLVNECKNTNVIVHGMKTQTEIPPYLWNADILLLPPSAKHPSAKWTSPVKLGEYLASGVPIVASRISALEDWVSAENVFFFEPDDSRDFI